MKCDMSVKHQRRNLEVGSGEILKKRGQHLWLGSLAILHQCGPWFWKLELSSALP